MDPVVVLEERDRFKTLVRAAAALVVGQDQTDMFRSMLGGD
jgi:hypothetical protein